MNITETLSLLANRKLHDRIKFQGLDISIENRVGSTRSGKKPDGTAWHTKMNHAYGYIRMTEGVDGDHVDCFIGPNKDAKNAYVIHQVQPETGKFDEDKCMLGFDSADEAKKAYLSNFDDPRFFGKMVEIPMEQFKATVLKTRKRPQKIAADAEEVKTIYSFIRKESGKFCVHSKKGKQMGCYLSQSGAKKRLGQIEYFKKKA